MYLIFVVGTTIVLPLVATIIQLLSDPGADALVVAGSWFVGFGVGVRLLGAGLVQIFRPQFTAKNLLGIDSPDANQIVQELGFANTAMGVAGIVASFLTAWVTPVAAVGGIFLLLAGIRHVAKPGKSAKEWIPTITDLILAVVLLVLVVLALARGN